MKKSWLFLFLLLIPHLTSCAQVEVSLSGDSSARLPYIFNPIDVPATPLCPLTNPLRYYKQNTGVWCWAASAQTVINYLGDGSVSQCNIVNNTFDVNPGDYLNCCKAEDSYIPTPTDLADPAFEPMRQRCRVRHKPLAALLKNEHSADTSSPPVDWQGLTDQLCGKRTPYISVVRFYDNNGTLAGRHSSVVGGARVTSTGDRFAEIGDHSEDDNFFLMKWEAFEKGVPGDFIHEFDYTNIKKN